MLDNIKASLDTQIEKIKNASINVKSLTVAHRNFFLYDNENMITEAYVSELNENISIYGLIAFLRKTNSANIKDKKTASNHARTQVKIQSEKGRL